ncbi:MAG: hypothetical protein M3Z95_00155 [Actinomycetota bacterium]|nr:hypothetical protein [Actinomycetota bacterium]
MAVALAAVLCSIGVTVPSAAAIRAHIAATLSVKDEGNLRFVKSSGSTLIDEGHASGTIPGNVRIHFTYNGNPNVSSQITIYGARGTLQVGATGRLSSPTNPNPSFYGTLTITGGSGRYSHAHGGGKLYGVFHRRTYGMIVQTQGTVHY